MEQQTEDFKRELVSIFFAQKNIILLTTLLIFICSLFIAFFWPSTYSATGSILVKSKNVEKSHEALESQEIRTPQLTKEDLASEVQILMSPDVIKRTIKSLKEKNLYPENIKGMDLFAMFLPVKKQAATSASDQEVYKIAGKIKTVILPASNVIQINYFNKDPDDAVNVLSVLMDQYLIYRMQVFNPTEAESFFSLQADKFQEGLERKGDELMDLVEETQMSDPLKEISNNLLIKKTLEDQLNVLENEAIEKRLFTKHLERKLHSKEVQFFTFLKDLPINGPSGLSVKLQELVLERGQTARTYSPGSERLRVVNEQINDTYEKLKSEVLSYKEDIFNQLQIAEEKIFSINGRLNSINARNVELQRQFLQSQKIGNDVKLLLDSYGVFSKRREEAQINSSEGSANFFISILNKAFPSNGPVFPKPGLVIPLGILVGFLTGCSLGFLRDYFDHTFKDPGDISNFTQLPVVFSIPEWHEAKPYPRKSLSLVGFMTIIVLLGVFFLWNLLFNNNPMNTSMTTSINTSTFSKDANRSNNILVAQNKEENNSFQLQSEGILQNVSFVNKENPIYNISETPLSPIDRERDSSIFDPFYKRAEDVLVVSQERAIPSNRKSIISYNKEQSREGTITVRVANIRAEPGLRADKIGLAFMGEKFLVIGETFDADGRKWHRLDSDKKGWISEKVITVEKNSSRNIRAESRQELLLNLINNNKRG